MASRVTLDIVTKIIFGDEYDFDMFGEDKESFLETYRVYSEEVNEKNLNKNKKYLKNKKYNK